MTIKAIWLHLPFGCWLSMGCHSSQSSEAFSQVQDTIVINNDSLHATLVSDALLMTEQDVRWDNEVELRQNLHYPAKQDTLVCFYEQSDSLCVIISFGRRFLTRMAFVSGSKRLGKLRIQEKVPLHFRNSIDTCSSCVLELSTFEGFNPFTILFRQGVVECISYRTTYLE